MLSNRDWMNWSVLQLYYGLPYQYPKWCFRPISTQIHPQKLLQNMIFTSLDLVCTYFPTYKLLTIGPFMSAPVTENSTCSSKRPELCCLLIVVKGISSYFLIVVKSIRSYFLIVVKGISSYFLIVVKRYQQLFLDCCKRHQQLFLDCCKRHQKLFLDCCKRHQ